MTGSASDSADSVSEEGIGCRPAALSGFALIGWALVVGGVGLAMVLSDGCGGICSEGGLALFYSAAPVSALFGVLGGGLPVAWPLDVLVWLLLGVGLTSWTTKRPLDLRRLTAATIGVALVFGVVMSRFVEVERLG